MIRRLIDLIIDTLSFTKTEAIGTLVLFSLIIVSISVTFYYISYLKQPKTEIVANEELLLWAKEVEQSIELKAVENQIVKQKSKANFYKTPPSKNLVIEDKKYPTAKSQENPVSNNNTLILLDINTASEVDLQKVKGIGKVFSSRIIKYRKILGGFYDLNQLNEVYGLPKETIDEIKKNFIVDSKVTILDINSDSLKYLAAHPYVSYDLAKVIMAYRKQNGDINDVASIKKIKAIDTATILKLIPYLD